MKTIKLRGHSIDRALNLFYYNDLWDIGCKKFDSFGDIEATVDEFIYDRVGDIFAYGINPIIRICVEDRGDNE